tara:strand:+ start:156 stop:572 length:417 start_codon:yes stop_codon:yes gene_type:complete
MDKFEGLDEAFETVADIVPTEEPKKKKPPARLEQDDVEKDYEYARANLYQLVDKGQEAINGALDLAMSSDHPRAYEVAGQLIKHVGDVADKIMGLQKDTKSVKEEKTKGPTNVTNALFVGSTADLQKMLKDAKKKSDK